MWARRTPRRRAMACVRHSAGPGRVVPGLTPARRALPDRCALASGIGAHRLVPSLGLDRRWRAHRPAAATWSIGWHLQRRGVFLCVCLEPGPLYHCYALAPPAVPSHHRHSSVSNVRVNDPAVAARRWRSAAAAPGPVALQPRDCINPRQLVLNRHGARCLTSWWHGETRVCWRPAASGRL